MPPATTYSLYNRNQEQFQMRERQLTFCGRMLDEAPKRKQQHLTPCRKVQSALQQNNIEANHLLTVTNDL